MKPILYPLVLTLSLILIGCEKTIDESELVERNNVFYMVNSDTPFTGKVISYHQNGQISVNGEFQEGKIVGFLKRFDKNGNEIIDSSELELRNDLRVHKSTGIPYTGKYESYWVNSQLKHEGTLNKGILEGTISSYSIDGELEQRWVYKNGLRNGDFYNLRKINGKTYLTIGGYKNGKKDGTRTTTIDDILFSIENYKDGIKHGRSKYHYDNGKLFYTYGYENGLKHGDSYFYNEHGTLIQHVQYQRGKRNGVNTIRRDDSSIKSKICYQNDEKVDMSFCEGEQNSN